MNTITFPMRLRHLQENVCRSSTSKDAPTRILQETWTVLPAERVAVLPNYQSLLPSIQQKRDGEPLPAPRNVQKLFGQTLGKPSLHMTLVLTIPTDCFSFPLPKMFHLLTERKN